MKLKKFLCLFLIVAAVLSFASCEVLFGSSSSTTKYTVAFDSAGGTAVASQEVESGTTVKEPTAPTKEGYTFDGWYDGSKKWDFANDKVTANVTLVAHWTEKVVTPPVSTCPGCGAEGAEHGKCEHCDGYLCVGDHSTCGVPTEYTISYYDGANKIEGLTPTTFSSATTDLVLPSYSKNHYNFTGWYLDAGLNEKVDDIDVTTEENIILYAGLEAIEYTVTYYLDDGAVNHSANPAKYTVEDLPLTFNDATLDGYEFLGWFTDANCTVALGDITAENAGNLVLFADFKYIVPVYTITYCDPDGVVISGLTPATYIQSEDDIVLPTYTLEGYTFLGWKDSKGRTFTSLPAGAYGDITLTANMQKDAVSHQLTLVIGGEVYNTINFLEEEGLETIDLPSKAGYEFSGWKTLSGILTTSIPANTTTDITLYGEYSIITYTIKYYDGETELTALTPTAYTVSAEDIALPEAPAKTGYRSLGWYDADGTKVTSITAGKTGDLVLTAKYELIEYTITYVMNGGENSTANTDTYYVTSVPALHDPASRDKYSFAGWYTDASFAADTQVRDLSDLPLGDITLYAKWVPSTVPSGTTTPEVPIV